MLIGMTPAEALRLIQGYAAAGRVEFTEHAAQRMRERGAQRADVLRGIATATTAAPQPGRGTWRLDGVDLDGDALTVACALREGVVVVTVF